MVGGSLIDVAIIGSGVMSATLAVLLRHLDPRMTIQVFEAADSLAQESSSGWHNAGTGHAGLCELSYTPTRRADGSVDVSKAIEIFAQFEASRQFWAWGAKHGVLPNPSRFLSPVPHVSFVEGASAVDYLRARHLGLIQHPFFAGMKFTSDPAQLRQWIPLMMEGRRDLPVAGTRAAGGTDVNFGELSRQLLRWVDAQEQADVFLSSRVEDLKPDAEGWRLRIRQKQTGERTVHARFVFVGAGGGTLPLLQKAGIPEVQGTGGFPIGGQWLVCEKPAVVERHNVKVYGQPLSEAPTMAVPHLDRRVLDERSYLLFGPFAAWTTKFLHKSGSKLDLTRSIKSHNLSSLVTTGMTNLGLIRYLVEQGLQTQAQRVETLRSFYPEAKDADWRWMDAGIRVQVIKRSDGRAGIVHYGTEVVTDTRRSLSGLLGRFTRCIRCGGYRSPVAAYMLSASAAEHRRLCENEGDDRDLRRGHQPPRTS